MLTVAAYPSGSAQANDGPRIFRRQCLKKRSNRLTQHWVHDCARYFGQRHKHKATLSEEGMGNGKLRAVDGFIPGEQDIDVNRARTPHRGGATPQIPLDPFHLSKQIYKPLIRYQCAGAIQELRLVSNANRSGCV